jgi:hypothetical protein
MSFDACENTFLFAHTRTFLANSVSLSSIRNTRETLADFPSPLELSTFAITSFSLSAHHSFFPRYVTASRRPPANYPLGLLLLAVALIIPMRKNAAGPIGRGALPDSQFQLGMKIPARGTGAQFRTPF